MDQNDLIRAQNEIERLKAELSNQRAIERNLNARHRALGNYPQVGAGGNAKGLARNLRGALPEHLVPMNVGGYNTVAWPFWFQVDFNFGTNPTLTATTTQTQSYQVTQEAAVILLGISRFSDAYSGAGDLGPWTMTIRDRQSSRQFNDRPIPLQMIGTQARPTRLPTGLLLMPNAFMDVTMATWLTGALSMTTVGEARHQFSFFGLRVRVEDAEKVLSSVFRS